MDGGNGDDEEMSSSVQSGSAKERSNLECREDSSSIRSVGVTTRRSKMHAKDEDTEMRSQSSTSTNRKQSEDKEKKKKDKKKKKKKDKKKKKKKDKKKKKKKKRGSSSTSDSSNSSESDGDWKFDDKGVNYGSPERISEGSSDWDGRSQELYDSDNPESNLNLYHQYSKARVLEIQDFNDEGDPCILQLDCLTINEIEEGEKKEKMSYQERRR